VPGPGGGTSSPLAAALLPLPFHRQLTDHLRENEAELWQWFASTRHLERRAADVRLELLKRCYRCERGEHPALYEVIDSLTGALGLEAPVTVYQAQGATAMNAFLSYVPGEAHVVLEGPVRDTLGADELRATLAHELVHYLLWEREGGELLVADQLLSALANHPRAEPSHVESARLFRLYLEVQADRGALAVSGDPLPVVSSLTKIETGLADASGHSYLRQADEILGQSDVQAEGITHPEAYIRARALQLWAREGPDAEPEIARLIEGPLDLGRLSLLGQRRLSDFTRRLLARFLRPAELRSEARLAHARLFFADLEPDRDAGEDPLALAALGSVSDSIGQYLCYVLLDLASADRDDLDPAFSAATRLAEELALAEPFVATAARELELGKRAIARLRKEAAG
jgi:hypothetical protein